MAKQINLRFILFLFFSNLALTQLALLLTTGDDLYGVRNYSVRLDLKILWRTLVTVLERKGVF